MAEPSIDLEKLVRDVLAELGAAPEPARDAAGQGEAESSSAAAPAATSGGELVVLSPVVTMSELEGRLEGVRRLVVPPQAVLTPSVRDELHRKRITLVYDQPVPVPGAGKARLVMLVLGSRYDPVPLARALQNERIEVDSRRTDCLVEATDQLAGEVVKPNTLGLVVSTYPAVAICLANRHQGVRAVSGIDAATADADAASVGANVLVVNPRTTGFFQIKQMISRFHREGARACPEPLRERLG
jgi:hypothetical protein